MNLLPLASHGNFAARERWQVALRSFEKTSGPRWFSDLLQPLVFDTTGDKATITAYPARDESVRLVLRKIIQGLSAYHRFATAIPDDAVLTDVLRVPWPAYLQDMLTWHDPGHEFVEYGFEVGSDDTPWSSAWYIQFYERCEFVALVRR
jgi:hypothetical protein